MQEETIATVKLYMNELDTLQRRHDELVPKKNLSPEADKFLAAANQAITEGRTLAASAPTTVATAAKSGNAEALTQKHYTIIEQLEEDIVVAKDNLVTFETFTNASAYGGAKMPVAVPPDMPPDMPVGNDGAAAKTPDTATDHGTPCSAELVLQCPEGQIDVCMKQPDAATHACVAK